MLRLRVGLFCAACLLAGCDHNHPGPQAPSGGGSLAGAQSESELTGLPSQAEKKPYPRATLVSLPSESPAAIAEASKTAPPAEASSAPSAPPPPETVTIITPPARPPVDSTSPEAPPMSAPTDTAQAPPALPSPPEPPAETPPIVSTPPVRAMDDSSSQRQVIVLETSFGHIVIQLDDVAAPRTCGNFRKLVSEGFYNNTTFHRIIPNFMIQGGDPNSKSDDRSSYGQGGPGYTLPAEIKLKHVRGAVAMARLPDSVNPHRESNGSQFYICVADCPSLDDNYTVFAHVIKGMDVADKIAGQAHDAHDNPVDRVVMTASLESKSKALEDSPQ